VEVYERDEHPGSRWEGYRIHIDPAGARSLRACLPSALWEAFLATSAPGGDFGFLTAGLDELVVVEESISHPLGTTTSVEGHYAVDRRTLRRLLLAGMDDTVTFGAEFRCYEDLDDGRVAAVFADGRRVVGDVLVGADGAGSRVTRQYLPAATPVPAGVTGVGHKLFLTEENRAWIPERLLHGMNLVFTDEPVALFTSVYEPPAGARGALERVAGQAPPDIESPYLLCAVTTDPASLPPDLVTLDTDGVRAAVDDLLAGWHPDLRRLLAASDPASRGGLQFSASPQVPPWTSTHVTLLGDAIHTMPATGGLGGNAALRDARLLARHLSAVQRGERGLLAAVAEYEAAMRDHGYAAVRAALKVRDQMLASNRVAGAAMRSWFRLCRASRTLRRLTFGEPPNALSAARPWERSPAA
jgi:2-polyprenyl-6-methoxyphenol hydroxylase-like FAD-dependent oxidoreductase